MPLEPVGNPDLPSPQQTDAELMGALSRGETMALGLLYDRHAALVYGLAFNALGNLQEAEDLTQDIFLTLVRGTSFDPKRGSLRTFLAILTRSRAKDRLRSRTNARQTLQRWQFGGQPDPSHNVPLEQASQQERSQEVSTALTQLSEGEQQILRLAYYEGLSQPEIAQQLELPLGTVKARARRGLLKLRQTLTNFTG
ncbi:MAG: sigma-70 family RNA polymerase sigma factor [Leptolyngbyaceae cyanobacterium bins.59]|nr:sigma-70 family RNA polymerase sigma factor [Leptolyngbyaceae cyanobacterium bins.59]